MDICKLPIQNLKTSDVNCDDQIYYQTREKTMYGCLWWRFCPWVSSAKVLPNLCTPITPKIRTQTRTQALRLNFFLFVTLTLNNRLDQEPINWLRQLYSREHIAQLFGVHDSYLKQCAFLWLSMLFVLTVRITPTAIEGLWYGCSEHYICMYECMYVCV